MTSYIYFIQAHSSGPIKIGTTGDDPRKRMVKIQSDCPWPVSLIGAIKGTVSQEKQIHLVLSRYRTQGEWFEPHPVVLAAINVALECGEAIQIPKPKKRGPKHPSALCKYRTERGLSLRQMTALTGITPSNLSRFESGKSLPSAKNAIRLCEVTGLHGSDIRPDWVHIFQSKSAALPTAARAVETSSVPSAGSTALNLSQSVMILPTDQPAPVAAVHSQQLTGAFFNSGAA